MALSKQKITEELVEKSALRLFDVAPCIFPDNIVIKKLKKEVLRIHAMALARFWRDNGPWALFRAMKLYNFERERCRCNICREENPFHKVFCKFWEKFKFFMVHSGISFVVIAGEGLEHQTGWFDSLVVLGGIPLVTSVTNPEEKYPAPEDFNPLTACEFMAPVSHINVHIVFFVVGFELGVAYGRKLWDTNDLNNDEIRKLDMLFARLRT